MCSVCEANATPAPVVSTPIFWSVVDDMRAAGHDLPWYRTFKPSGTITTLSEISYGMHTYYSMMVRDPMAAVLIGGLDLT